MLDKNAKIYVAGHRGLVGSAIWKTCKIKDIPISLAKPTKNSICWMPFPYVNSLMKNNRNMYSLPLLSSAASWQTAFTVPTSSTKPANTAKRHR